MMTSVVTRTDATTEPTEPTVPASQPRLRKGDGIPSRPAGPPTARLWRVVVVALGGLLIGTAVAGIAALILTINVGRVGEEALRDVRVEHKVDDFRIGVVDLRHYHRNVALTGPTRVGLADLEAALAYTYEQIDALEGAGIDPVTEAAPRELRAMVDGYAAAYRSAIESYASDRVAFETASDAGLIALATLQDEATKLDTVGEQLSEGALLSVGGATSTATLILIAVLLGVGAVGLALSVAAIRVMRELRGLEAAQGETASALAAALRSKTNFIADASHELRTPLTVLRGNAEVALAVGPAGCDYDEVLREIVTNPSA